VSNWLLRNRRDARQTTRAGPVRGTQPLRHDACEAELAGLPEDQGAVFAGVLADDDADLPLAHQPRQALLAVAQGQAAEVLAVELSNDPVGRRTGFDAP
jgi:hypothetical protein